jgi:mycothiol synthase
VAILSNFLHRSDDRNRGDGAPVQIRPAREPERLLALRMVLGGQRSDINDQFLAEFVAQAPQRGIDLSATWIAEQNGQILLAALPMNSPGRSTLIFSSPCPRENEPLMVRLLDAVCGDVARHEIDLAQALVDPADENARRAFETAKFELIAELLYLQCAPRKDAVFPAIAPPLHWKTYSPATHGLFAATIQTSYHESLDCPALTGRRDIEDVIVGHKASGIFDPKLWYLLCEAEKPLGVLLLSAGGAEESILELVYIGLTREARGRGLGAIMIKHALATVVSEKFSKLSLAVDSRNIPALKLYYRHGMDRFTARLALMRDLRNS